MNHTIHDENIPQLGYFLEFRYWRSAVELLNYQLKVKETNRHFNTLSMFYYEGLGKNAIEIHKKKYFNKRVANNLFYGLEDEFAIYSYPIPKSNLGLRNYKFFTYPMRVLYYSIALYLLHLSQELVQEYYSNHKHIQADYGGKLLFDSHDSLILNYDSIWYKPHYKRFRSAVRREIKDDLEHKIVIHVDIQNYYDEISIPILLNFLNENVKPSIQRQLRFDAISQAQIATFFEFMANGKLGIPQSDNDVTSSYIGYLYLAFGDLLLDQEIRRNDGVLKNHKIIRYLDDLYISLTFEEKIVHSEREIYINSLSARIADCLYDRLGLRLNTKTRLFWLSKPGDADELLRNLKKVSPGYEIPDDEDGENPNEKVERIFRQLDKLKRAPLDPTFDLHRDLESEVLKEIYTPSVSQLLQKPENKARIKRIFIDDFNFDLVIAQPREILIIMLQDNDADKAFRKFLLSKRNLTSREVHLILTYLCQTSFKSQKLIRLLQKSRQMGQIMKVYKKGDIASKKPGYYELGADQVLKLATMHNVIEQIRLRVLSERQKQYSVALNHLLNEIHTVCFKLDTRSIDEKEYNAIRAVGFLINRHVPHETCVKVRNLFDRRNKNPVSHADPIAWPVSETEYLDYHHHVGVCLGFLL